MKEIAGSDRHVDYDDHVLEVEVTVLTQGADVVYTNYRNVAVPTNARIGMCSGMLIVVMSLGALVVLSGKRKKATPGAVEDLVFEEEYQGKH